jgi:hypothetical protein
MTEASAGGNTPSAGAATPSLASFKEHPGVYDIAPLEHDGNNYVYWKLRTETVLKLSDLWGIVNGDIPMPDPSAPSDERAEWSHKDLQARAQITLTVKDEPLHSILDATTAKECWDKLAAWYKAKWEPQHIGLMSKVVRCKLSDSEPLGPQLDAQLRAARIMASIGQAIDDKMLALFILTALPPSLYIIRDVIISAADQSGIISSEDVISQLILDEDLRVCASGVGAAAFFAKAAKKKGKGDSKTRDHLKELGGVTEP